jgi:hypothetical protein
MAGAGGAAPIAKRRLAKTRKTAFLKVTDGNGWLRLDTSVSFFASRLTTTFTLAICKKKNYNNNKKNKKKKK